jgi:hypothetical protein
LASLYGRRRGLKSRWQDQMGVSIFASEDLPAGHMLAFCRRDEAALESLTDRQCTASLLALHKLPPSKRPPGVCRWLAYVDSLPESVLSPIFYTKEELALLEHTNLHGSTLERREEWAIHHKQVLAKLQSFGIAASDLPLCVLTVCPAPTDYAIENCTFGHA